MRSTFSFKEPGIAVVTNCGLGASGFFVTGTGRTKGGTVVLAKGACCAAWSFFVGTTTGAVFAIPGVGFSTGTVDAVLIPGAGVLATGVDALGRGGVAPLQVKGGMGPLPS